MQKNSTIRVARRGNLGAAASGASKRGHRPGPSARVAGVAASDARARAATREEPPALGPSGPRRPPPQPLTVHPALACGSPSPAEPFPAGPSVGMALAMLHPGEDQIVDYTADQHLGDLRQGDEHGKLA